MEMPMWLETWNLELLLPGMARRFQLQANFKGLVVVSGESCWERFWDPRQAQEERLVGLILGNMAAKWQALTILALSDLVFALEMPARLYITQSQRILETFPSFKCTFNIRKAVSRKDDFPETT